jgi:hypothetical protein
LCLEVNSQLPPYPAIAINYDPERMWDGSYGYGMSYGAALKLMGSYGYRLIRNFSDTNLLFVLDLLDVSDLGSTWSHPETLDGGRWWEMV